MSIYKAVVAVNYTAGEICSVVCENPFNGDPTIIMRHKEEADALNAGVQEWIDGELIQVALPFLSDDERELMLCGFVF